MVKDEGLVFGVSPCFLILTGFVLPTWTDGSTFPCDCTFFFL